MRIIKPLLCVFLILCCSLTSSAYDLVVVFNSVELHTKIADMKNVSVVTPQLKVLARGAENKNDTTYIFKNLPKDIETLIAVVNPDNSSWTQIIETSKDTIKVDVPLDFVPQIVNLGEVEVKADNSYLTDKKAVFLPSKRDRRISSSGIDLIFNMAIPTLEVSPLNETVTTVSGDEVSMYIDYAKASQIAVENLNTNDVLRVEVYDNPSDPRFNGDRHVVNFVLVKYEYGGYTRVEGNQRFILNQGRYGVYSRMAYKDMIYEAGIHDTYKNNSHGYTNHYSIYNFQDKSVDYNSIVDRSMNKNNLLSGVFKAAYRTKRIMVDNTVSITSDRIPGNITEMTENFSSDNYKSGKSMSETRLTSTGINFNGSYFFDLKSSWSLMITPRVSYSRFNSYYEYSSSRNSVINDNEDHAWNAFVPVNFTKQFGAQSLMFGLSGESNGNNMTYGGDIPAIEKYRSSSGGVRLEPSFRFGSFYMRPGISLYYQSESIGGYSNNRFMLQYYIPMEYTFNNKMNVEFSTQFYNMSPGARNMAPNLQLQNQIMALQGNPDLRTQQFYENDISFFWRISRCFSIAPYVQYTHTLRDYNVEYESMEINGRDFMIRRIINEGVSNNWSFRLPVSFNTPNRKLTVKATPQLYLINLNGIMGIEKNYLRLNAQFTYSFSKFFVTGSYATRDYNFSRFGHTYNKGYCTIGGGWSNGSLRVRVTAICPFQNYKYGYTDIVTSNYISHADIYSPNYHSTISLTVSYTFSYGKKINRGNEAEASMGARSGLLQ